MTIAIFAFSLIGAMALGMNIAFALLVCSVALMVHLDLFDAQIIAQNLINGADAFTLLAVPFFILAGEIMNEGGISKRIIKVAMGLVGHKRGGLGYVAILAAIMLSALSGSAVADAAALSSLLVPMMVAAGHNRARACGLVAAGGIIAPVIPPSIGLIIFGVAGNVSISKLFMAGIMPGIMMGVSLAIAWWWCVRAETLTPAPRASRAEVLAAIKEGFWALLLPVIIIAGLRFGIFTPTEAGVVAVVYSLLVATLIYRELTPSKLYEVMAAAAKTSSIVMLLVAASLVVAWLITVADLPGQLVEILAPLMEHPTLLLVLIMVLVMLVGTAMDMTPTILILTPVLLPVVVEAGIDPVYFGIIFIINNAIGLLTPPVGTVLNVVAGVGKVSLEDVIKGVWPFLLAQSIVLALLVLFPSLVMVPAKWFGG
jgi:tripartite ATP-independent transporter DctM subunit